MNFETATLTKADGDYPEGLVVTTDPARSHEPSSEPPVFVDPQRFAAWKLAGTFGHAPKKGAAAAKGVDSEVNRAE